MASHPYALADEEDELGTLGREPPSYDTSAALQPDELPDPVASPPVSRGRRFAFVLLFGLFVAAGGAGISFALRSRTPKASQSSQATDAATSSVVPGPVAAPVPAKTTPATTAPTTVPSTTVPPVTTAATTAAVVATVPTTAPPLSPAPEAPVKTYTVQVIESLPHDTMAFTQGFEYADGFFYEGTGLRGSSSLRRVEPNTGKVVQRFDYPEMSLFGEGITLPDDSRIVMLTWQSGRGFVFDRKTLNRTSEWNYPGEGWGLCTDKARNEIYMSDGTSQLRVLDPATLKEKRRVTVTLDGATVTMLNELEWICDEVWANVWQTKDIYRIDPASGRVKSRINAAQLPLPQDVYPGMDVLNGIAHDPSTNRLWLTGKKWSKVYLVNTTDASLDLTKCR